MVRRRRWTASARGTRRADRGRHPSSSSCAIPRDARLPEFTAGAHVSLRLPSGVLRKYSLCNDPAERDRYVIAVKRETAGRGGSISLLDSIRGRPPRPDHGARERVRAERARGELSLHRRRHRHHADHGHDPSSRSPTGRGHFKLYYCTRTPQATAFLDELSAPAFPGTGHDPPRQRRPGAILGSLAAPGAAVRSAHLYCCGPRAMMEAVRDMTGHWSRPAVHFESFVDAAQTRTADDRAVLGSPGALRDEVVEVPAEQVHPRGAARAGGTRCRARARAARAARAARGCSRVKRTIAICVLIRCRAAGQHHGLRVAGAYGRAHDRSLERPCNRRRSLTRRRKAAKSSRPNYQSRSVFHVWIFFAPSRLCVDALQMAERKLRLGVAGLGRAFTMMLPTLARHPRVQLVAAADPRDEARQRFTADFGGRAYASVEALCDDTAVEAVYVATPHQHHAQHACLAAAAGKHVLVEKPMALTLPDCRAMIEAARTAGVALVVGHSHSFDAPDTARARDRGERSGGQGAHDHRAQFHRLPLPAAAPGGARHRQRRRRAIQPGCAPGRRRAAARRRPGEERARRDGLVGPCASDRRRLLRPAHLRRRRFRVHRVQRLRRTSTPTSSAAGSASWARRKDPESYGGRAAGRCSAPRPPRTKRP